MSASLPVFSGTAQPAVAPTRDGAWLRAARQARVLSWVSLGWMTLEGLAGLVAGLDANSISVVTWAASSAAEGLASAIVIWRFTGRRTMSEDAEHRAQRWVAASFFLLAPYLVYEAIHRLAIGEGADTRALSLALTASSVVGMPLLGYAKLRLARRLGSSATAGEGVQNLLCAAQAAAALAAVALAGALPWLDPVAAVIIAGLALREGAAMWRGDGDACCSAPLGFPAPAPCEDDCCASAPGAATSHRQRAGGDGADAHEPRRR